MYKLSTVVLIVLTIFSLKPLISQSNYSAYLFANALTNGLNQINYVDEGENFNAINVNRKGLIEFGVGALRRISSKTRLGLGLSYKSWKYDIEYILIHPTDGLEIRKADREMSFNTLGLRLECRLGLGKWVISPLIEYNAPRKISANFENNYGELLIHIDPVKGSSITEVNEVHDIPGSGKAFIIPEVQFGYHIKGSLYAYLGIKYKPYGHVDMYNLKVSYTESNTGITRTLNDVKIWNRFALLAIGLNVRFDFAD
jgi:hypothetical protein